MLILSNLINGTYNFSLAVTNNKGKVARDNVTLTVLPNPLEQFVIQVYLDAEISTFSQDDQVRGSLHSFPLPFGFIVSAEFSSPYMYIYMY